MSKKNGRSKYILYLVFGVAQLGSYNFFFRDAEIMPGWMFWLGFVFLSLVLFHGLILFIKHFSICSKN